MLGIFAFLRFVLGCSWATQKWFVRVRAVVRIGLVISTTEIRFRECIQDVRVRSFPLTVVGIGIVAGLLYLLCAPFPHRPVTDAARHPCLLSGLFLCASMFRSPQALSSISGTQGVCHNLHELPCPCFLSRNCRW